MESATRLFSKVTLELTARCNFDCVHCCIRDSRAKDLSTMEWKRIIDLCVDAGCLHFFMTGGEPTAREDFGDLYRHAKSKGVLITLYTNGSLLTPRLIDLFREWPPRDVMITMYGLSEKRFGQVTKRPGLYGETRAGIERMHKHGIPFHLNAMILKENLEDLPLIAQWAKSLEVVFRTGAYIRPRSQDDPSPLEHRGSPKEVARLERLDKNRRKSYHAFFSARSGSGWMSPANSKSSNQAGTHPGRHSIWITHKGRLCPDLGLAPQAVPVGDEGIQASWNAFWRSIGNHPVRQKREAEPCHSCPYMRICAFCLDDRYTPLWPEDDPYCKAIFDAHRSCFDGLQE